MNDTLALVGWDYCDWLKQVFIGDGSRDEGGRR